MDLKLPLNLHKLPQAIQDAWRKLAQQWRDIKPYKPKPTIQRKVSRGELDSLLNNNVCEIVFLRRRPERAPGRPVYRRMLCTNSMQILNSQNGRVSLNFRFPQGPKQINEAKHNVVVTWDIIMQDYRNVSMDDCMLIQEIPANEEFWKYFNEVLYPMSTEQKMSFMDTV